MTIRTELQQLFKCQQEVQVKNTFSAPSVFTMKSKLTDLIFNAVHHSDIHYNQEENTVLANFNHAI